jgi:6-pyruvoyltetrahydropterin/6-carboxytetrahydropterin synthase
MFRLSREIRFSINSTGDDAQLAGPPSNSFGGFPTATAISPYLCLQVSVAGVPSDQTGCVLNIKEIDQAVRSRAIPICAAFVRSGKSETADLLHRLFEELKNAWPGVELQQLRLFLNPYLDLTVSRETTMVHLSQKFEFSASHRLHNPALSDEQNRSLFGKCNNPNGHGHNYVLQVTLGAPAQGSLLPQLPQIERVVAGAVIDRFDHKNLNVEIPEFRELIPTVENIARVIYKLLKPKLAELKSVTVWETTKTWCEYGE